MAFENGVVLEDWRSTVIVPLYRGKGRGLGIRDIEALVVGKIFERILVDRVRRVTDCFIDYDQGDFRSGRRGL